MITTESFIISFQSSSWLLQLDNLAFMSEGLVGGLQHANNTQSGPTVVKGPLIIGTPRSYNLTFSSASKSFQTNIFFSPPSSVVRTFTGESQFTLMWAIKLLG